VETFRFSEVYTSIILLLAKRVLDLLRIIFEKLISGLYRTRTDVWAHAHLKHILTNENDLELFVSLNYFFFIIEIPKIIEYNQTR